MSAAYVPSLAAEQAIRAMLSTVAQHRRQEVTLASGRRIVGRLRRLPTPEQAAEVRRQATYFRLVSLMEAFVTQELVTRFEAQVPPPRSDVIEAIYTKAEDAAIASWSAMTDHYRDWLGIRINQETCRSWRDVQTMTNVRNAISHGVGDLTRRMARKDLAQLEQGFRQIEVEIEGRSIRVSDAAVRLAAMSGRSFVEWLDEQLMVYDEGLTTP